MYSKVKKLSVVFAVVLLVSAGTAFASGLNVNLDVFVPAQPAPVPVVVVQAPPVNDVPPAPVYVAPTPMYAPPAPTPTPPPAGYYQASPPPGYAAPAPQVAAPLAAQVVLPAQPPQFVYVPELGYYVAVGVPYDLIYVGREYYYYSNGYWFRASRYGTPWIYVGYNALPKIMRRHSYVEFRAIRDREFGRHEFKEDRRDFRGEGRWGR